jgi:flagellar motor switch protein FliN
MLTPDIAPDVVAQCQIAHGEIGQALARAFGNPFEVSIGEPTTLRLLDAPELLEAPGVVVALHFGVAAMAIVIPQGGGVLPRGYDSADPKSQSKLTTLAQELGMLVLPEALLAEDAQGFCALHLVEALCEGGSAETASVVQLSLKSGEKRGEALLVWPLSSAGQIKSTRATREAPASANQSNEAADEAATKTVGEADSSAVSETPAGATGEIEASNPASDHAGSDWASSTRTTDELQTTAKVGSRQKGAARGPSLRDLPPYSRSLLKIRVPLSVTLAEKKQPLGQILEIGPGSILQFEKSCEEMLDLNVSNLAIARGEAVKVGDKFGLRVTSLILPSERFKAVQPASPLPIST